MARAGASPRRLARVSLLFSVERRLRSTNAELRRARTELGVLDEQTPSFDDVVDDTATKALVSDDGNWVRERNDAVRHARRHAEARDRLVRRIAELERRQDELLDRLPSSQ